MPQFFFLSGLPRSGTTLLQSILTENPDIYSDPISPVCGTMMGYVQATVNSPQYASYPNPEGVKRSALAILENYVDTDRPFVLNKSWAWIYPESVSLMDEILPYEPKYIVLVRDILEILASFISLIHSTSEVSFIDKEIEEYHKSLKLNVYRSIDDTRCDYIMRNGGVIDSGLCGISNLLSIGSSKKFLIVEYNDLVTDTRDTLRKIYNFLEIPYFNHNLFNIRQSVKEDDLKIYGLPGMHTVRSVVSKRDINPEELLSPYILRKYAGNEIWRNA